MYIQTLVPQSGRAVEKDKSGRYEFFFFFECTLPTRSKGDEPIKKKNNRNMLQPVRRSVTLIAKGGIKNEF